MQLYNGINENAKKTIKFIMPQPNKYTNKKENTRKGVFLYLKKCYLFPKAFLCYNKMTPFFYAKKSFLFFMLTTEHETPRESRPLSNSHQALRNPINKIKKLANARFFSIGHERGARTLLGFLFRTSPHQFVFFCCSLFFCISKI